MDIDIKESGKITKYMVKVRKKDSLNDLLILALFIVSIGIYFWSNGDRYEGEWKDDKMHGYGKKMEL